jgi:hypothetical protein
VLAEMSFLYANWIAVSAGVFVSHQPLAGGETLYPNSLRGISDFTRPAWRRLYTYQGYSKKKKKKKTKNNHRYVTPGRPMMAVNGG